jgi:hypothetical protein
MICKIPIAKYLQKSASLFYKAKSLKSGACMLLQQLKSQPVIMLLKVLACEFLSASAILKIQG